MKESKTAKGKTAGDWLKEGIFYVYGMVYMMVRIAVNVTATMMPFYLDRTCGWNPTADVPTPVPLALVPLISYIMSMLFSIFVQQRMTQALRNRFLPMLLAICIITLTSVPMGFLTPETRNWIYPLAAFQGIGLAIMLNTATSLISDVIGQDSANSAFVYGCYSLFDKFANGILLFWMVAQFNEDGESLKIIIAVVPPLCALASFILTWIGVKFFSHKLAKITGIK